MIRDLSSYTLHSGGAAGGDTFFGVIGKRMFNLTKQYHYRPDGNVNVNKLLKAEGIGATVLSAEQMDECYKFMYKVNDENRRKVVRSFADDLKARNYYQVKNSHAVYAMACIKNDRKSVYGGTNYAIQYAIYLNKLIYVYDYNDIFWYVYDQIKNMFVPFAEIPMLSESFAGIGSRKIQQYQVKDKTTGEWVDAEYDGDAAREACKKAIIELYTQG